MKKRLFIGIAIFILIILTGKLIFSYFEHKEIGREIDSYKGVPVFYNGMEYTNSYGKNFSKDGYYYGQKWQCVEYIKRFYYDAKGHKMPEVYGNAKDFFDDNIPQGELNKKRNLYQYRNGGNVKPEQDDLIVFNDTKYGHVAIITEVKDDYIEVIQQNIYGKPRARYNIKYVEGNWFVGTDRKPAGWLRKK